MLWKAILSLVAVFFLACEGAVGPIGPEGPAGEPGSQGPPFMISPAELIGTWSGEKLTEDATGMEFVSAGIRTITFNDDGTYTSDLFSDGTETRSGAFLVVRSTVVVTESNPAGIPLLIHLEDVEIDGARLEFVLDVRPSGGGFQLGNATIYRLQRS